MLGPSPPDATCPYLGLFDDRRSHFTFATEGHRCFAPGRPIQVDAQFQAEYCLSAGYPACKRYRSAEATARRRSGAPIAVTTATVTAATVTAATVTAATPAAPSADATPRRASRAGWVWGLLRLLAALVLLSLAVAMGLGAFGKAPPDGGASSGVASPSLAATTSATAGASVSTAPSPIPTVAPAPTPIVHVVAPGESLSSIALIYGVTVEALQAANNIDNPSLIRTGQRLTIPTPP